MSFIQQTKHQLRHNNSKRVNYKLHCMEEMYGTNQ